MKTGIYKDRSWKSKGFGIVRYDNIEGAERAPKAMGHNNYLGGYHNIGPIKPKEFKPSNFLTLTTQQTWLDVEQVELY